MPCHGNPPGDHCCHVDGVACPNLLQGAAIATAVEAEVSARNLKGQKRSKVRTLDDGITVACGAAIKALAAHIDATNAFPDRATFEQDWATHPDYQQIGDVWETIGKPRDWCVTFGPTEQQCCFAQPAAVVDPLMAAIPVEVRGLRLGVGG